ncbi:hypothetical protein ACFL43_05695, partial [Thermodesulfobacteriota bacterium]
MKKILFYLFAVVFFVSCGSAHSSERPTKVDTTIRLLQSVRLEKNANFPREYFAAAHTSGAHVSIRCSHVLDDSEIREIESLGCRFK